MQPDVGNNQHALVVASVDSDILADSRLTGATVVISSLRTLCADDSGE